MAKRLLRQSLQRPSPPARSRSSWKKLADAKRPAKDVRDIAQLRVVVEPRAAGPAALDFCSDKQL